MSNQPFCHLHRVTYAECTAGNHVYYARYLEILEEARGEMFRSAGLTFQSLQEMGVIFPAVECQLRYKSPARYDDVLSIEMSLSELSRVRLGFASRIFKANKTLVLEATTLHVATGLDEKPKRMVPEMVEKLSRFLKPPG